MDWAPWLQEGETVIWEGRPAPTCFTFRNWRHSVYGILLLLFSTYWLLVGVQLQAVFHSPAPVWVTALFILVGLYFGIGHLLHARLEWEKVFYAVTDRRVLVQRGYFRPRLETLALGDLTHFRYHPQGEDLGSFRLSGAGPTRKVLLACIDHPRRLTVLLESALADSRRLVRAPVPSPAAEPRD